MASPRSVAFHEGSSGREEGRESDRFGRDDTVVVFDWDDTLLPTSWLAVNGMRLDYPAKVPREILDEIAPLEEAVVRLLSACVSIGRVAIITNAERGWVRMTAARYMPRVVPLLKSILVLSARTAYEATCGADPHEWKRLAFRRVIHDAFEGHSGAARNVVSLGDSVYERQAVMAATKDWKNTHTKSVKFCERPTTELMVREIDMVLDNLSYVMETPSNLDLMLTGIKDSASTEDARLDMDTDSPVPEPEPMDSIPTMCGA